MTNIAELATIMQTILMDTANNLARTTGFVRRQRKLTGATFVQALVFGWLSKSDGSLAEMSQSAANVGVAISRQGLEQRFTPEAVALLQGVLEAALQQVLVIPGAALPVLERFNGVYLMDSTVIVLPDSLITVWPGCGGSQGENAALKISVGWEMQHGNLCDIYLHAGREHDQHAPMQSANLPVGALRSADLGYFKLKAFARMDQEGVYWLSRYKIGTALYTPKGQRLHLVSVLAAQTGDLLDLDIQLGARERIACRLLAQRVPEQVVQQRRDQLLDTARKKQQPVSPIAWQLAVWTIGLTNAPRRKLSLQEVLVVLTYRWQMELLFKLWKNEGQLDEWRTTNPIRIQCEIYAKLIAGVVQNWLFLMGCWQNVDRSLTQARRTIQKKAWHLANVLGNRAALCQTIEGIVFCLSQGCRIGKSRASPRTFQRLVALKGLS